MRSSTIQVIKKRDDSPTGDNTFLTSTNQQDLIINLPHLKPKLSKGAEILNNQSLMSISDRSSLLGRTNNHGMMLNKTALESINASRRVSSVINGNRYKQGMIPTENLKFESLCKIAFGSQMSKEQMKFEIQSFVQNLETNYNERISTLQQAIEKQKKAT